MAHLPPRPEFDHPPGRYPPADPRHYTRPPLDSYPPPRERDGYPPRSPPRPSHLSSRPPDSYPPRPLYPPPPPYGRREDDRYRLPHSVRDWERRDRDYPPPSDWRHRGDPREWTRDRDRDRAWRPADEDRRPYERDRRERSPLRDRYPRREDDRRIGRERMREPSLERKWIPRASKSPPRRMVTSPRPSRPVETTPSRPRSPHSPPRRRPVSPGTSYRGSPRSPAYRSARASPRSDSPEKLRLGNHSISLSPRYNGPLLHARGYADERGMRGSNRSRSRSPIRSSRSPRKQEPIQTRTCSPNNERNVIAEITSRLPESTVALFHQPITAAEPLQENAQPHSPLSPIPIKEEAMEENIPIKVEPALVEDKGKTREAPMEGIQTEPTDSLPLRQASSHSQQPHKWPETSSPPIQPRNYVKTPTTPMSPKAPSPFPTLPPKPEWTSRGTTLSASTPPTSAEPVTTSEQTVSLPDIPKFVTKKNASLSEEAEAMKIRQHREKLTLEYTAISLATRRAMHELDLSSIDLRMAEKRRKVTNAQLERARAGVLGIDYDPIPLEEDQYTNI